MSAYLESLTTATGLTSLFYRDGTTIGGRVYYSLGGSPEMWREEDRKLRLTITESITGRSRIFKCIISDPRNIKESIYTPYLRICVVDYLTGLTLFLGRIEKTNPYWHDEYGQVLEIIAKDYSYELADKKVSSNYGLGSCTNGTGICNSSPVYFSGGTSTITVTTLGTFTIVVPTLCTATITSGTTSVTGSPLDLTAGSHTITTTGSTGTFTIALSGVKRSALIAKIIQDYRYNSSSITTGGIETSGSSDTITRDYTKCGRTPMELIEELAKEDPWTDVTWSGAGKVYVYTGAAYVDETTDADDTDVDDVNLMNNTADYLYLGQNNPFIGATFNLSTNGSYGTITWQYYNNSWITLTTLNSYDFTASGTIKWELPSDWSTVAVNGTTKYWIRCSVASVTTQAKATTIACVPGYGYDYYVDNTQVFQYFRRSSRPSGGPVSNGLTVALGEDTTATLRSMLHEYSFSEEPIEIVTRITVYGTDNTGAEVSYTAIDSDLESSLSISKIKEEYVWGSEMDNATLTTYCTNRAKALLSQRSTSNGLIRGEFSFSRYPYFGDSGSETLVKVGDIIHIHCSPRNIDTDFLILEILYEEPKFITKLKVVSILYGRSYSPFENSSILQGLRSGTDISMPSAKIGDLIVNNAQIYSCSISKLTAGDLSVVGTITSSGKFQTAVSPNPRIEITNTLIAGYSDATTKQFYLQATDGKAMAGGGKVILDVSGITLTTGVDGSTGYLIFNDKNGVKVGDILGSISFGLLLSSEDSKPIYLSSGGSVLISAVGAIDCYGTHIRIPNHSTGASTPETGDCFYDTDVNKMKFYNGSAWETITSAV